MFFLTVVFLRLVVSILLMMALNIKLPIPLASTQNSFDTCFFGNESQLNLSLMSFCPLKYREEFEYQSSCVVILDENGIDNQACSSCEWRERIEAMCYPSKNADLNHCCCRTPNCNKRVIEDAIPGWGEVISQNGTCISASLRTKNKVLSWTHRPPENCANGTALCSITVKYDSQNLIEFIEMGCLVESRYDKAFINKCKAKGDVEYTDSSGAVHVYCCLGMLCNRKQYRANVFGQLQTTRLNDEIEYNKLLEEENAKPPVHIWATDRSYYMIHPVFVSIMCIYTAIYTCGLYYIYVIYKPMDIHKRPYPLRASQRQSEVR